MKEEIKEENALQLLCRLDSRIPLHGLNRSLFPSGPHCKEIVEITGDPGAGKTYILTDLIARSILPSLYRGQDVGGVECSVVLLNLDHHFNCFRLVRLMEVRVRRRIKDIGQNEVEEIISRSLKRLAIVDVFTNEDFTPALLATKNHICSHVNVSLVAMDSICTNYWSSVANGGIRKIDLFVADVLKSLHLVLGCFKITFIYSRPSYFISKGCLPSELSEKRNLREVNTRIKLKQHARKNNIVRLAEIHSGSCVHVVFYEVSENGIEWN